MVSQMWILKWFHKRQVNSDAKASLRLRSHGVKIIGPYCVEDVAAVGEKQLWRRPGFAMTTFRDSFKYYKSRKPPPDLCDVIDFAKSHPDKVRRMQADGDENSVNIEELGLRSVSTWKLWKFVDIPGLIFIENPFTARGQRYWITKCLKDYSRKPNKLNLHAHDFLSEDEDWWDVCADDSERSKNLLPRLRWATLGYHHNWDTKHYSDDSRNDMPLELIEMTAVLARVIRFNKFKAEAAIINYYRMNSTLAGHTDNSEVDKQAPLFSISFGQPAIFLIGGLSQDDPAHAMMIRSGDVVVMTGESRLRYHGIPKILSADTTPWNLDNDYHGSSDTILEDWPRARTFISEARININVRQVLRSGQTSL